MTAYLYDIATDSDREVTQDDLDRLQRTARAFGELVKRIKFHHAEVRNGLVHPGQALDDVAHSMAIAERIAMSLDLDQMMQTLGQVHGRHVLVVER